MATSWEVFIDWDNDGFGSADNISAYVLDAAWNVGLSKEDELTAGEQNLRLSVKNADKRFSPEYSSGPYYGLFLPKRRMKIQAIDDAMGTVVMWTGYFDDISPQPGANREKKATIMGVGAKSYLERKQYQPELMSDVRADEIIEDILLDSRELPPGTELGFRLNHALMGTLGNTILDYTTGFNLQAGNVSFPFAGDTWSERTTAYQVIADVARGERGRFFFDRGGTAIFWNRRHLQGLYLAQGTIADPVTIDYVFGEIVNEARAKVYPRTISAGSTETLWNLEEPIIFRPGQERTINPKFSEEDREIEISGRNFQPVEFTFSHRRRWIERSVELNARGAKIHIHNTDTIERTLSSAVIKGQKISHMRVQEISSIDSASQVYGRRSVTIDTGIMNDLDVAESLVNNEAKRKAQAIGVAKSVGIRTGQSSSAQLLGYSMGTVVRVADTQLAHEKDYLIIGEKHQLRDAMKVHDANFYLAPLSQNKILLLGITGRNELDGTNLVGF